MLNYVWAALILIGLLVGGLLGTFGGEEGVIETTFSMARVAVMNIALPLAGLLMMWMGLMHIAERAGLISILARVIHPVLRLIFPDLPRDHPAMGSIVMNMAANMLGLGNAATPLGLKAMEQLESLNPHKGTATNAMCTFLAINTSSVTLVPATAIGILAAAGVREPHAIVATALTATLCSTVAAIFAVKVLERLPVFRIRPESESATGAEPNDDGGPEEPGGLPRLKKTHLGILALLIGVCLPAFFAFEVNPHWRTATLDFLEIDQPAAATDAVPADTPEVVASKVEESMVRRSLNAISVVAIPAFFLIFITFGLLRRVPVFECFVDGAKEGFQVAVRIMPYLVAMLIAMGIFRESGALGLLQAAISPLLSAISFPVELLPLGLMRPLSGGGAQGMLAELVANPGLSDSLKYTAATMFGSTETTFYVLAVYFGSVGIRRTRHALAAGLFADLVGVLAAVYICRFHFGA